METRHVKLDFEEALSTKKQILTIELQSLRMLKKIKTYKLLRKKEVSKTRQFKTQITSLKSKINTLQSTFPREEIPHTPKEKRRKETKKPTNKLQKELEEIKEKLAELNKIE